MQLAMTQGKFEALLEYFRNVASKYHGVALVRVPGYAAAARLVKMDRDTVKRAFEHGWPDKGWKAIRDVLMLEEVGARAERERKEEDRKKRVAEQKQREDEALREDMRRAARDLAKSRAALGELTKNAIAGAATLVRMLINIQPGLDSVTKNLNTELLAQGLTFKQKLELLKTVSIVARNMAQMSVYAAELEAKTMTSPQVPEIKEPSRDMTPRQLLGALEDFLSVLKDSEGLYDGLDEDDEGEPLVN